MLTLSISRIGAQNDWSLSDGTLLDGKSIVKLNLTSMLLKNYSLYGERILNNRLSVILGVNTAYYCSIPLVTYFNISDKNVQTTLNKIGLKSFALTPEMRIYTGSGFGEGFYLSPYFKYEKYYIDDYLGYFNNSKDENIKIGISGNLKSYSGGLAIGYQWLIGTYKNFVIDYTIFGIHGGRSFSNFHGIYYNETTGIGMSDEDQQNVKNNIEDVMRIIPLTKHTTSIDDKNVNLSINSPWIFFRMGISVGYRF